MSDYSIYPGALDGYSQLPLVIDEVSEVDAKSINRLRSAIINIEDELGVLPSGEFADVVARLEDFNVRIDNLETVTLSNAYRNDNSMLLSSEYGDFEVVGTEGITFGVSGAISLAGSSFDIITDGRITATAGLTEFVDLSGGDGVKLNGVFHRGSGVTIAPPLLLSGELDGTGDSFYHLGLTYHGNLRFDLSRNKWLSDENMFIYFGRNGATAVSQYYRGPDGLLFSSTRGVIIPNNATIVALGISRSDTDTATFQFEENGVSIHTFSSSAVSNVETATNVNIDAGTVFSVKNNGPNDTSDVMGWVKLKFRG